MLRPAPVTFSGFCDIEPVPKERPRFNSYTKTAYTPTNTKRYEELVRKFLEREYPQNTFPMSGAIIAQLIFVLPKPKSVSKKTINVAVKPDIDNLVKSFLDACDFNKKILSNNNKYIQAGVFENDSRISELHAKKIYVSDKFPTSGTFFKFAIIK